MASAKDKLAAVTSVPEPPDIESFSNSHLQLWTYSFQGQDTYYWDFASQMTDLRVLLDITQASTVEVDLEDSDFEILNDPLFAHWAWDIQDVSLSSQKKFTPTRLTSTANTAYLGDSANLEWVLGQKPIDFGLGDATNPIAFRMCGIKTQQTTLTLTLEDRVASFLRDQKGSKSWGRAQHTRAQFVAMLCREAGVDYFIPELNVLQPIAVDTSASTNPLNNITNPNGKGLSKTANLTVLGMPMSNTQKQIANVLLGECHRLNAPLACWQAILYAGVGETGLGTNSGTYVNNSAGAIGVLQGTDPYWDSNPRDVAGQADCFLQGGKGFNSAIDLAKQGIVDPAEIAVRSEVPSIWPSNAYEAEWGATKDAALRTEIDKIIAAYGGPAMKPSGSGGLSAGLVTSSGSYAFTRGANETSWDCIQRLASEVAWYAFVRQNRLWFVSGNYLFSQEPQLTIERGKNGVDYIDLDLDMGERDAIAQCMVYCRSGLWTALPGMVVEVVKRGPASGKWIVANVENHPRDATQECIVTLQKPIPKRSEPSKGGSGGSTPTSAPPPTPGTPAGAYWAAQQLAATGLPYPHPDVHYPLTRDPKGTPAYDCSESVSWVLLRGGFPLPGGVTWGQNAPVSGQFVAGQAGLVAGRGKTMTIWATSGHVFIEFNIPGKPHMQGNTVNPGSSGFGFFSWDKPGASPDGGPSPGTSYQPVHYPGT